MSWDNLTTSLRVKCGFEATDINDGENQVRILGRVPSHRLQDWLFVMDSLDDAGTKGAWTCDLSKKYFRRNRKLVYAWRLIFQGEGVLIYLEEIVRAVNGADRSSKAELTEFPLIGSSPDRDQPLSVGKRGAGLMGHVRTGAAAKG